MPTVKKMCRVCGKSYEACRTMKNGADTFRWQDVACSPECGAKYFKMVMDARKPVVATKPAHKAKSVSVEKLEPTETADVLTDVPEE